MGNRLLLADDSITIQKVVAIIFANEEFELTVVDNGVAALDKAREIRPDVMLVDALMPGKTGYEVCAEIRRDPELRSTPILLLIGAFENPDEEEARSCGADASISKPFESQQLIDRVQEMLELGRTRSAALAARPLPVESAAEELWGDLSSFDTMAPVAGPAAPEFAAPVAAPAASTAVAQEEPSPAKPAVFEQDIVEADYEDDLWGAFELEEAPVPAAAAPLSAMPALEPEAEFEAEQFFSFEDDSEAIEETGPALEEVEEPVEEPVVLASDEDMFSFSDGLSLGAKPDMEPLQLQEYEPLSLEPEQELEFLEPEPLEPEAYQPVDQPIPVLEPQSAPIFQAQGTGAGEGGVQPGAAGLSESELVAALSKISREVIERIVWEVVPDLAEVLIKEEIRKLKAGIRG